jgi:transcriptional regulator with XRE-family HTH domain
MGYGGKVAERERARELRAQSWTLTAIAAELGVSKSSVSVWVRDVDFEPRPRSRGHRSQRPHPLHLAKLRQIEECDAWGRAVVGELSDRELLLVGAMLYAGEGDKRGDTVKLANTDPRLILLHLAWLRRCFVIDERRFRMRLYLHEGLDLEASTAYWSGLTGIPPEQFTKPYRAVADATRRRAKHEHGCPAIVYADTALHRRVMGLVRAITSEVVLPG